MSHDYFVTVSNVGTVCQTNNRHIAMREFGAAKRSAAKPGGRDGWETVTLFRDNEPVSEFIPGPFFYVELTDTFSGEANYSWVTRVKVHARNMKHAIRRFSSDAGFVGRIRHDSDIPDEFGTKRYSIQGAALCFFVSHWNDDAHGDYFHIREL